MIVEIKADVGRNKLSGFNDLVMYRLFVDHELFTERTYIWDGDTTFVRENIIADLTPGDHIVVMEFYQQDGTQILQPKFPHLFFKRVMIGNRELELPEAQRRFRFNVAN
jgi:hypothetical protein